MPPRFAGRLVVRVSAADVGRRVSLRRRLPDGTFTDVVGTLESWTPDGEVSVRRRDGSLVTLRAADLVAGKRVPPPPARRPGRSPETPPDTPE